MSVETLLSDIREFIITASRSGVTESELEATRFNNGSEIVEAIDAMLANMDENFNPYYDPDTVDMLERAGIATYRHRNR